MSGNGQSSREAGADGKGRDLDTSNMCWVGRRGEKVVIMGLGGATMSCQEAAVLAAWLVLVSGEEAVFYRAMGEIKKT